MELHKPHESSTTGRLDGILVDCLLNVKKDRDDMMFTLNFYRELYSYRGAQSRYEFRAYCIHSTACVIG